MIIFGSVQYFLTQFPEIISDTICPYFSKFYHGFEYKKNIWTFDMFEMQTKTPVICR